MKKNTFLLFAAALLFVASCKKSDNTTTTNNNNNAGTYYFNFKLDTATYNISGNQPEYMFFDPRQAGGYQVASISALYPSMGISFEWPDTVRESDVLALAGKTLYFSDTAIQPSLEFQKDYSSTVWYSTDTANTSFYIKVNTVTFLKKDNAVGTPVRAYVITGTCSAVLSDGTNYVTVSNGSFNTVISIDE